MHFNSCELSNKQTIRSKERNAGGLPYGVVRPYFCGMPLDPRQPRKLYKVVIPDDPEAEAIVGMGIVTRPAIERGFQAFSQSSDQNPEHFSVTIPLENFKTQSDPNRILVGAAMMPDTRIPRVDENGELYDLVFTKEAVKWLAQNFERRAEKNPELRRALNFEHSDMKVQGVITNSYIQSENDFSQALGLDSAPGAWVISCFIEDPNFYQNFIDRKIATGFSIEIVMDRTLVFGENFTEQKLKVEAFKVQPEIINGFLAFGQTPFASLIDRTPTPAAATFATLNAKNVPEQFKALNQKIAKRQPLSWEEFGTVALFFFQAENNTQTLGGAAGKEWIESTFATFQSKVKQADMGKFRLVDEIMNLANAARFRSFVNKLERAKKNIMKIYEAKSAFEKLKCKDGLKYFLENETELQKLFKKKGII